MMLARRSFLALTLAAMASPVMANQAVQQMTPADAHIRVDAGTLTLIDVRTPEEWADGGIASGAQTIAMQDPALGARLAEATGGDKSAPVALICRTGARSSAVAAAMQAHGYTNVYSVTGGMVGSGDGPGWRRMGLPVEAAQ